MGRRNLFVFIKSLIIMPVFLVVLLVGISYDLNGIGRLMDWRQDLSLLAVPFSTLKIDTGMGIQLMKNNQAAIAGNEESGGWWDGLNRQFSESMVAANLYALASSGNSPDGNGDHEAGKPAEIPAITQEEGNRAPSPYKNVFRNQVVYFYCTHSAESYIPDSGVARMEGRRGLVNNVADLMAQQLNDAGLKSIYVPTIHDSPDYNSSYTRSRETVKDILQANPDLAALFDVHRDSIPGQAKGETTNINGKACACILIIVGTNERKTNPYWEENRDFAVKLYQQSEKMYPGLIKGVRTKAGTYNQEFFPHSLLLEFGNDHNSAREAYNAGELFTHVLLEVLAQEV